ncbi:MAG: polysaccharide deacetylase family protein [Pseudoflavonifractor sp.]
MFLNRVKRVTAALAVLGMTAALTLPGIYLPEAAVQADVAGPGTVPAEIAPSPTPSPGVKHIAITFDDGPRRATTARLLDGLAERGVPATFFLVGSRLDYQEDLVRRMEAEGHQVGIHTYDHVELIGLSEADFNAQVDRTRKLLTQILGHNDFLLRPPYGMTDPGVKAHAAAPIILWSVDPEDWNDQNADRVTREVIAAARDGSIILMHDIFHSSVDAALRIVDALHRQGYLFVTVSDLFAQQKIGLEQGKVYWNAYP